MKDRYFTPFVLSMKTSAGKCQGNRTKLQSPPQSRKGAKVTQSEAKKANRYHGKFVLALTHSNTVARGQASRSFRA